MFQSFQTFKASAKASFVIPLKALKHSRTFEAPFKAPSKPPSKFLKPLKGTEGLWYMPFSSFLSMALSLFSLNSLAPPQEQFGCSLKLYRFCEA